MGKPASPESNESSENDEESVWEIEYITIEEKQPMFEKLSLQV